MTFQEQIETYLKDLPSKWKDQLVSILCQIKDERTHPTCDEVKDCETLTSLSDFSVEGDIVSVVYTDEHSVQVTRSFSVGQLVNNTLEGIDPECLTDQTTWDNLTYSQRIQLLIDNFCDCCS